MKTEDINARLFGKADKRKVTSITQAQQSAKDKVGEIELAIAGEPPILFELKQIPYSDIATKTFVFEQNSREQSLLNEHALSDLLTTMKDHGQQYPAFGRLLKDGMIEVLDGSRRRLACQLVQKDFLIYVSRDVTPAQAKFLSDITYAHKPLSLYERGKEMRQLLDSKKIVDQRGLAQHFQCSEALVSCALKAAMLPLILFKAYPSVSEVGRPTIIKLHNLYHSLNETEKQKFIDVIQSYDFSPIWHKTSESGLARVTQEISQFLELCYRNIAGKNAKKDKTITVRLAKQVKMKTQGDNITMQFNKMTQQQKQQLMDYIKTSFK